MTTKTLNYLRGASSIFDLMPQRHSLDLSQLMPRETPADMMAKAWSKVGADIETALRQCSSEKGNQEKSA